MRKNTGTQKRTPISTQRQVRVLPRTSAGAEFYMWLASADVILHPFPFGGSKTAADGLSLGKSRLPESPGTVVIQSIFLFLRPSWKICWYIWNTALNRRITETIESACPAQQGYACFWQVLELGTNAVCAVFGSWRNGFGTFCLRHCVLLLSLKRY